MGQNVYIGASLCIYFKYVSMLIFCEVVWYL